MTQYKGVSTLEVLKDAHHYNEWIASNFLPYLSSPFLEIGSGTGNLSQLFSHLPQAFFSDVDEKLVGGLNKRFSHQKNVTVLPLDLLAAIPQKYHAYFSAVLAINVLEHINDDSLGLRHMKELLKKKGTLLLLVPAKKFAFTKLDSSLGHYRRYEKEELLEKVTKAGFVVKKCYAFNIVGLLSWLIRARVEKEHTQLKSSQVKLFDSIVPPLRFLESIVTPPIGISYIVVAQKP